MTGDQWAAAGITCAYMVVYTVGLAAAVRLVVAVQDWRAGR